MTWEKLFGAEIQPDAGRESCSLRALVLLLSISVLLTVYQYYGTAPFFRQHLEVVASPGFPLFNYATYSFLTCILLLLVVPAFIMKVGFKESLAELGLGWGDWKLGLKVVAVLFPLIALLLIWPTSRQADFQAEYPLYREAGATLSLFMAYEVSYGLYYLGWEFFFRGYMLFGLRKHVGDINAILIQTIPSTLMHIGKPDGEIFAAILAGLLFGLIALRTRSIVYVFLLHWLIGVLLDVLIVYTL
jgi:membrane protease YdiL (CAAX protease family)